MLHSRSILGIFILIAFQLQGQNADQSVFQVSNSSSRKWTAFKNNDEMLYKTIAADIYNLLKERDAKVEKLNTKEEWENYKIELKNKIFGSLNKFKKTPLNAEITGKIKRKTFTVEKIVFESHPGFFVTGCMFIPKKRQKPAPAVIYVSGHSAIAFRSKTYQHIILNLVQKGFIVFAYDPIGQGERLQYPDPETNRSKIGGPTTEHSYAGAQTLLAGTSLSDYFIWDGVRAVDYLATRKEVDMKRIGLTGRSGGGTQTAMIAAYDDRIYAAAPECYITNFKRLFQSIGPQDAEQNMYHAVKKGFDFPDYFHLRAPKPSLIVTTTRDFFSIQGARETFAEAKRSYSALGHTENMEMTESYGVHESTKENREAVYAFFQKHLNLPGDSTDKDVTAFSPKELWATETGQVVTALHSKTVFDLNKEYFKKEEVQPDKLRQTIKEISGTSPDRKLTSAVFTGKLIKENYVVEKYFLENDKNSFALPVWVVKAPGTSAGKILLWLTPKGKQNILKEKILTSFLSKGYTIISADMPGTGELHDPGFKGDGYVQNVPFNYTFGAMLAGKSITGIIAGQIDLLMQFVSRLNTRRLPVDALIEKEITSPFLHFTAFKAPFSRIVFQEPMLHNRELLEQRYYDPLRAFYTVPGSLPFYENSDLLQYLPDNSFKILYHSKNEKDHTQEIIDFLEN